MQYLGGKLSAAQLHVTSWMGSMRHSLQGALDLMWGASREKKEEEEEEEGGRDRGGGGRFQRAMTPLRSFARRSRRSLRRFSVRSRPTLQRRTTEAYSTQVTSYATTDEDKDTDALIDDEPIQQEEACEQPSETDSPQPVPEEKEEEKEEEEPEVSPEVSDTTDLNKEEELVPFPESSTPLLDTRLQRSKAVLSKRRTRSRPSRVFRAGLFTPESPDWRTCDSTDEKEVKQKDSEEEEEPKSKKINSSSPASQRVPMFPGLSPSALLAQLKKRTGGGTTGGGGGETEEDKGRQEMEIQKEEKAAPSPSQLSRSPRTASHMAGAARVLPPLGGADKSAVTSPAWLKELKSKKRLSQHEGEA